PRWHSETGAQINLVTEKSEGGAEPRAQVALDGREFFDRAAAELCCDRCESFVCVVARQSKRHDGDTFDAWMIGREIVDRAAQDFAVVDLRAEHNLRVYLDLCVEQTAQLCADVRAPFVHAEQVSAHIQVGRMHRDVLRRQTLFYAALHLVFRDRGERRVVTIDE